MVPNSFSAEITQKNGNLSKNLRIKNMNEEKKQKQKQLFLWGYLMDHYLPKV